MQVGGYSGCLHRNEITADTIDDRLKDGDALESGHGEVQNAAAKAWDRHRRHNRCPAGVEHLLRVLVTVGQPTPERNQSEHGDDAQGADPGRVVDGVVQEIADVRQKQQGG